jgi:hypothetical protein
MTYVSFNIMSNLKQINRLDKKRYPHIVISPENYYKLKSLGKMGDTFDKIVGDLLSQKRKEELRQ